MQNENEKKFTYDDLKIIEKRCAMSMVRMVIDEHKGDIEFSCDESKTEIISDIANIVINFNR